MDNRDKKNKIFKFFKKEKIFIFLLFLIIFFIIANILTSGKEEIPLSQKITGKIQTEIEIILSDFSTIEKIRSRTLLYFFISGLFIVGIIIFAVGIILDIYYLLKVGKRRESDRKISNADWSIWDVVKVSIVIILIWHILYFFKGFISSAGKNAIEGINILYSLVFSTFLQIIGAFCVLIFIPSEKTFRNLSRNKYSSFSKRRSNLQWVQVRGLIPRLNFLTGFIKNKYNKTVSVLDLKGKNIFKNIYAGFLGYVAVVPVVLISLLISNFITQKVDYKPASNPLLLIYFLPGTRPVMFYLLFFISFLGPFCEEIFFRGFLYKALRNKLGIKLSILISSAIFSFLHLELIGFLPIFVLAGLLAYIYERTGSLIAPITVHIMHNTIISVLLLTLRNVIYY